MSSCRKLAISIAVRLAVSAASQRLVNAVTVEVKSSKNQMSGLATQSGLGLTAMQKRSQRETLFTFS
jgi:hypothetical protein